MKKIYYWFVGLAILIVAIIFISYNQKTISLENECSSLKIDLRNRFNELSKSCSIDTDCTEFSILTECLTPCGTCISKNADVSTVQDVNNKVNKVCPSIDFCAPSCAVSTCKCIDNICKKVAGIQKVFGQIKITNYTSWDISANNGTMKISLLNDFGDIVNVTKIHIKSNVNDCDVDINPDIMLYPTELKFVTTTTCNNWVKQIVNSTYTVNITIYYEYENQLFNSTEILNGTYS
jgi:hypothetical protein